MWYLSLETQQDFDRPGRSEGGSNFFFRLEDHEMLTVEQVFTEHQKGAVLNREAQGLLYP